MVVITAVALSGYLFLLTRDMPEAKSPNSTTLPKPETQVIQAGAEDAQRPEKKVKKPEPAKPQKAAKTPSMQQKSNAGDSARIGSREAEDGYQHAWQGNDELDGSVSFEIDPLELAEAELALVRNQMYEEVARETLPTLSIQTHNPVWQLQNEVAGTSGSTSTFVVSGNDSDSAGGDQADADSDTEAPLGPLPAPESGEFGNIQPPEGEIWLRIPADYASEHRDIMAQNADLYRSETGWTGPLTVMLWVGGRPYYRQIYE